MRLASSFTLSNARTSRRDAAAVSELDVLNDCQNTPLSITSVEARGGAS
jgi:hypothetical protein